jgi:hypothetical protein
MIRLISCVFFLSTGTFLLGQVGLNFSYAQQNYNTWNQFFKTNYLAAPNAENVYENAFRYAIDYRLKLPNKRIEFYPEINFSTQKTNYLVEIINMNTDLKAHTLGLGLRSQFYIFDIDGDCDCPTFSRSEPFLKKGTYLFMSAGYYRMRNNLVYNSTNVTLIYIEGNTNWNLGVGLGIDIGLSEHLTLSPYYKYEFNGPTEFKSLNDIAFYENLNLIDTASEMNAHVFGARLILQFKS